MSGTNHITDKTVLLIGDTILDHYIYGTLIGTSAETPTLVAREQSQQFSLGGASLVCRNLLELKAKVHFMTLMGEDSDAEEIYRFSHPNLTVHAFCEERQTTVKRRYWVDGYKLLQFDKLDNRPISQNLEDQVVKKVKELLPSVSVLLISDYRHGFLTESLINRLLQLAKEANCPLYVDSQVSQSASNHHLYRGATVVCLNQKEARFIEASDDLHIIANKLDAINVIVKRGAEGAVAWIQGKVIESPAFKVDAVDTCGAGDAFLAALALQDLACPETALAQANRWAALSTTVKGPQPPSFEALS